MSFKAAFTGSEPGFTITKFPIRGITIFELILGKHLLYWNDVDGQRHTPRMKKQSSLYLTVNVLTFVWLFKKTTSRNRNFLR